MLITKPAGRERRSTLAIIVDAGIEARTGRGDAGAAADAGNQHQAVGTGQGEGGQGSVGVGLNRANALRERRSCNTVDRDRSMEGLP